MHGSRGLSAAGRPLSSCFVFTGSAGVSPALTNRTQDKLATLDTTTPTWRSRGYLRHIDRSSLVQALTFRLYDAVPDSVVQAWKTELAWIEDLKPSDPREIALSKRIAQYEDAGHGHCWLRDERIAGLVEDCLLHFDGQRYRLISWCIMPNHVHSLIEVFDNWSLARILHSWKSFTAHKANEILERTGEFWFREYFDRFVRDDRHFANAVRYVEENPVKAGLAGSPEDWRWSSAYRMRKTG